MESDLEELNALRDLVRIKDKQIEELESNLRRLQVAVEEFVRAETQSLIKKAQELGSELVPNDPPPPETI